MKFFQLSKKRPKRARRRPKYEDLIFGYEIKQEKIKRLQGNTIDKETHIDHKFMSGKNFIPWKKLKFNIS